MYSPRSRSASRVSDKNPSGQECESPGDIERKVSLWGKSSNAASPLRVSDRALSGLRPQVIENLESLVEAKRADEKVVYSNIPEIEYSEKSTTVQLFVGILCLAASIFLTACMT